MLAQRQLVTRAAHHVAAFGLRRVEGGNYAGYVEQVDAQPQRLGRWRSTPASPTPTPPEPITLEPIVGLSSRFAARNAAR